MLLKRAGLEDRTPVPLHELVDYCRIKLGEVPLEGCLGIYLPPPIGPGILLNANQGRGQRRFTLAHEIGHFAIPSHSRSAELMCAVDDLVSAGVRSEIEREANQFAAELLMPRRLFRRMIGDRDPTFSLVAEIAGEDHFEVSLTSAAIKLVKLTREPCALVCSENGRVVWWMKSPGANFFLTTGKGDPTPRDSLAFRVRDGEMPNSDAIEVPSHAWLGDSHSADVYETTLLIPSQGRVLSLVWAPEKD